MIQLASAAWLPTLLLVLLFCLPGCVPLRGPSTVTGTVGESLSVKYQYEEEFKTNDKYWCRESPVPRLCGLSVTTRSSKEARNGRVSIRDHPDNLTFTVTLENLTLEDAGTYLCAVDIRFTFSGPLPFDKYFRVVVSVVPAQKPTHWQLVSVVSACDLSTQKAEAGGSHVQDSQGFSSPGPMPGMPKVPTSQATEGTTQGYITEGHHEHHEHPGLRSLLSSLSFQILVFLKLPLLLSMLSAVLWVSRPLRCSGKKQHWPD